MQNSVKLSLVGQQLNCEGDWNLANLAELQLFFSKLRLPTTGTLKINGEKIHNMDVAGAWFVNTCSQQLTDKGLSIELIQFSEQATLLFSIVQKRKKKLAQYTAPEIPSWLASIGKSTANHINESLAYLAFIGKLSFEFLRVLSRPSRIRWNAFASAIMSTGYYALPIIALLSFMIGIVLAYQMGNQLRTYGANVFIVDLLGISVLREFGPLITAIMVAGRTGSAFTAQLGLMKANQEIDALDTMGVTPAEVLLIPRIIGLLIALPLLTIWSDIFGVIGGMVMANNMLNITWNDFIIRFQHQVPLSALVIGLGKAPIFALLISSIGCFCGIQVSGSALSIGENTTKSVVRAIFYIIVADAIFSVIFSKLHL